MSSIRGRDTKPEMTIRRLLWSTGKRYRIHDRTVIGKPDISSKKNRVAIFIDGCFWHGCSKCYIEPRTNSSFWRKKIKSNKIRRVTVRTSLKKLGWEVLEFWEHDINRKPDVIASQISRFLK